jgi:manganese/zinc/iron transport system permease protein
LLTVIQSNYGGEQSGLDHYIFGNAAAMTPDDSTAFAWVSGLVLILVLGFYHSIKSVVFNLEYADAIGINVKFIDGLISFITILSISVGIKAVGYCDDECALLDYSPNRGPILDEWSC